MIRILRIGLLGVFVLLMAAGEAQAQLSLKPFYGVATMHLGSTTGSDVGGGSFTMGGSVSVVETTGWGAEFDFGYANEDDSSAADNANLQTYMMNLIGSWPTGKFRPFFVAGAGGMRVRGCAVGCPQALSWTDWGINGGAGALYRFNSAFGFRGDVRYFKSLADHPDPRRPDDFDFWRISVGISYMWNIVP